MAFRGDGFRGRDRSGRVGAGLYFRRYSIRTTILTRIQAFLRTEMKLTLSPEKTLITDVRKQYIHFLGYEYKVVKGKGARG